MWHIGGWHPGEERIRVRMGGWECIIKNQGAVRVDLWEMKYP